MLLDSRNRILGIATKNAGKFRAFFELLSELNLKLEFINDIKTIKEGNSARENAIQKAVNASSKVGIPVLATDESLTLSFLNEEHQPKAQIKRIIKEDPTEQEMLDYYRNILDKQVGKMGQGIVETYNVIAYNGEVFDVLYEKKEHIFKNPGSNTLKTGRPLATLDYYSQYDKYFVDLSAIEKKAIQDLSRERIIAFVDAALKNVSRKILGAT